MASNSNFSRDEDNKKKEQNWFMKTAVQAAAFAGTAFGAYGLWKVSGPARKILEKAVDDRMKKVIAEQTYRSSDKLKEVGENFLETRKDALSYLKEAYTENIDPWTIVDTSQGTRNHINRLEEEFMERLEIEANLNNPETKLIKRRPGQKLAGSDYKALNKKGTYGYYKTVSLKGKEAQELGIARNNAIQKYLRKYGSATVIQLEDPKSIDDLADISDFFFSTEYLKPGDVDSSFGGQSIERIKTIHEAYMSDYRYSEIYAKEMEAVVTRMRSRDYAIVRKNIENYRLSTPGGYRQIAYGGVDAGPFDPKAFRVNPLSESIIEFSSNGAEVKIKKSLTSQGRDKWDPTSKWAKLQLTDYTGQVSRLLQVLKDARDEGYISTFDISLFDYGTAATPDKRLRVTMVGTGTDTEAKWFDLPISVDGRLPGSTPGLQQRAERYHQVGEGFGFIGTNREINTSQRIIEDVARNLEGSLLKGQGNTFSEDPKAFLKRIDRIVNSHLNETAAADGSAYGLFQAMGVDDPSLKDLVFSDRAKHGHTLAAAKNFVISARNTQKLAANRKNTIIINLDLETLDNTGASPEKTLLTRAAQIVKAGIVVQDGNKVLSSHEIANRIGYEYFKEKDNRTPGQGFNRYLSTWLRKGVLPENLAKQEDVAEAYRQYLEKVEAANPNGWSKARNNTEFIKEISGKIQAIMDQAKQNGKDVVIVTKNGLNFDLMSFLMYDPDMYAKLKEKSIDIQALHWYKNAGLGESNALKLESVMRVLMGRLNVSKSDFMEKGDIVPEKIFDILKTKALSVQGQSTILLDWTADAYKEFHDHKMPLTTHAMPSVDAAFTAALNGETVVDYVAGEADYINAADHLDRIIKEVEKGPLSPEFLKELFDGMNNKTLRGFSLDAGSQNMIAQLIANYIDLNDLSVIASPGSQAARRLIMSPFNMTLNKGFVTKSGGNRTDLSKQYLGRFTVSQAAADAATYSIKHQLRVGDDAAHFSNTVRGNFLYRIDWAGQDRTISLTNEYMNMFSRRIDLSVPVHGDGAVQNNKIKLFIEMVHKKAEELAKAKGVEVNMNHIEAAEEYIRRNPPKHLKDWRIKLDEEILSANKFGGEIAIPHRGAYGEIRGVLIERDTIGSGRISAERLLAKIEYMQSGHDAFTSSQLQLLGNHGATTALAEAQTAGLGSFGKHAFHGVAGAEFLKKADLGAFKNIMLNTVLTHLNDRIEDKGTNKSVKKKVRALRDTITQKLKMVADLKNNRFVARKNSIAGSPIDEQVSQFGSIELRISQLIRWYRDAGLIYSKEEIKQMKDNGDLTVFKQMEDTFVKAKDDIIKQMKSGHDVMTPDQLNSVEDDLTAMISLFQVEHEKQAGIKAFQLFNYAGQKALGLISLNDVGAIYNHDPTTSRGGVSMFRQDYLFGIAWSLQGRNKSTMEYLTKYTYAKLGNEYASAMKTGLNFNNALFTSELVKNKSLNIAQITSLVDVQKRVEERREKVKISQKGWKALSYQDLSSAYLDTQRLLENNAFNKDPAVKKQLEDEAKDIIDLLGGKTKSPHLIQRLGRLSNVYSNKDISDIEKLAIKGGGVLQFELPSIAGSDALTVDIDAMLNAELSKGYLGVTPYEMQKYKQKLISTIKINQEHAKKGAPIRLIEGGKLEIGAAIFDWDPTRMNNFNFTDGLDLANRETQLKIQAMEALYEYQNTVQAYKGQPKNPTETEVMSSSQSEFIRKYMLHLLIGQGGDKGSNFWKSGQFAVNSVRLIHKDINSVWANIAQLESTNRISHNYLGTINAIKSARLDTVLIHEDAFRSFKYSKMTEEEALVENKKVKRWVSHDQGERVSAARVIADNLRSQGVNNAEIREYFTGRKALPGGIFDRFPISQSGYDGVRTGRYLVIPREVADKIGVDQNSVFTNPVYLAAQKADFDGDQIFCHLKEIAATKEAFGRISEEDDATFNALLRLDEVQAELKKSAIVFEDGVLKNKVRIGGMNSVISQQGANTVVSTINSVTGNVEFKTVKTSMLDYGDMTKHVLGLVLESAKRGGRATSQQLRAASEASANTLISKNLIPLTTNLLKQRMFELIGSDTGNVKAPVALMTFMGNIKHGIAGMAQGVIEMGKHSEKAAALSATYDWLRDPTREAPRAKEYYLQMRMEQMGKAYDAELEEAGWDFFSGKLEAQEIIRKNNPEFKMMETRALDFLMGKQSATRLDVMSISDFGGLVENMFSQMPDFQERTFMGDLNDALSTRFGRQIDVAPKFRKAGKYGAIGAAAFMGLSMFTPFGNSKSLNPIDMFTDLGNIDGNPAAISSNLELGRGTPLDVVDASFSKEAFIRLNKGDRNEKKNRSGIINSMLMGSSLVRNEGYYEFQSKPYKSYTNYTTRVPTMGTSELKRRSEL